MSLSSQTKRLKNMSESSAENLCPLCATHECTQESSGSQGLSDGSTTNQMLTEDAVKLPSKETIGQYLHPVPNEVIHMILKNMSLTELSNMSITNKWFRDFTLQYFFESKTGLPSLLGPNYLSTNAKTASEQCGRLDVFFQMGLNLYDLCLKC